MKVRSVAIAQTPNPLLATLKIVAFCCLSFVLLTSIQVYAADDDTFVSPRINVKKVMKDARSKLSKENYKSALRQLKKVTAQEPKNADAWSLRGFSERKLGKQKNASKAYNRALEINPVHKGALSYQGELFLQQNNREKALINRKRLAGLCPDGCSQLDDLDKALNGEGKQVANW